MILHCLSFATKAAAIAALVNASATVNGQSRALVVSDGVGGQLFPPDFVDADADQTGIPTTHKTGNMIPDPNNPTGPAIPERVADTTYQLNVLADAATALPGLLCAGSGPAAAFTIVAGGTYPKTPQRVFA